MIITKIDTIARSDELLFCRVETDTGLVGYGETYYIPTAVSAIIHDWMADRLLGADPMAIDAHWRFLYERATNFGSRGAELRAISALDLALWDIKGKAADMPVWQLLGGRSQDGVRIYNSSGGPAYGGKMNGPRGRCWPGHGPMGEKGLLNDYWSAMHEPVDYAKALLDEGIGAVKMWPLDFAAHKPGGAMHVSWADLEKGLRPFFAIREALGDQIELIFDGHGFFQLPMAERIAKALGEVKPLWLEDVIRPDCISTIRRLRERVTVPLAVSEMFSGPDDFRQVLEAGAADYVMIDPTWVGGITQTLKITDLAQFYNVPVVMHDCTGPLTLLAGLQVGIARGNVAWQETLRAHIRVNYPKLISAMPEVVDGRMQEPQAAGIGGDLLDSVFEGEGDFNRSEL